MSKPDLETIVPAFVEFGREAYQKTGLKPRASVWDDEDGRACVGGAIAKASGRPAFRIGFDQALFDFITQPFDGLNPEHKRKLAVYAFSAGVTRGFDGADASVSEDDWYLAGFACGQAARKALLI